MRTVPSPPGAVQACLTVFNSKLYFQAEDEDDNFELWVFDGTNIPSMVHDINPTGGSRSPTQHDFDICSQV